MRLDHLLSKEHWLSRGDAAWWFRAWPWTDVLRRVLTGGTSISWRRRVAGGEYWFLRGSWKAAGGVAVFGALLGPEGSGSLVGLPLVGRVTGLGLHRLVEPFWLRVPLRGGGGGGVGAGCGGGPPVC